MICGINAICVREGHSRHLIASRRNWQVIVYKQCTEVGLGRRSVAAGIIVDECMHGIGCVSNRVAMHGTHPVYLPTHLFLWALCRATAVAVEIHAAIPEKGVFGKLTIAGFAAL